MEAEGTYAGKALEHPQLYMSHINIHKVSDNEVSLHCISASEDAKYEITIPTIALSGKPYDVTFDCQSHDATIKHNSNEPVTTSATVKGWIKIEETRAASYNREGDPATPAYDCEINISCKLDGKELRLKITRMSVI